MSDIKFVSLAIFELLAFNTQKVGSRDPVHDPFTLFSHSGVGGRQVTSFELWTTIIGSETTPEKCFNIPIENALCMCQFGRKWGKNSGYPYWILTPNERDLSCQVPDVCAKFHQNRLKIVTVRARTVRHTDGLHIRWKHLLRRSLRSLGEIKIVCTVWTVKR